jgi:ATP-dependent Clp protease protease subunit
MSKDFNLFGRSMGLSGLLIDDYIRKAHQSPFIIEERKMNAVTTDIFSKLMQHRIIFLGDEIDSNVSNIVQAQLLYLASTNELEDVTIYLNTPGGSIPDGLAIYNTMQTIKPDVRTVCTGMAASMGSILLVGGTKGKRKILPDGRVLIHQPWGDAFGTAADLTIQVNEINKYKNRLYEILAHHTGKSIEEITKDSDRDFWLDAQEALDYGCVDEIVKSTK